MNKYKPEDLTDYSINDIDPMDYPTFTDAYLNWAIVVVNDDVYTLTVKERDYITKNYPEWIREQSHKALLKNWSFD